MRGAFDRLKILLNKNEEKQEEYEIVMPYGIHKGKLLSEIPASYFRWIWTENRLRDFPEDIVHQYIVREHELIVRELIGEKHDKFSRNA